MKYLIIVLFILGSVAACTKDDNGDCQSDQSKRRGAVCNDGTESTATGSGACSSHGGVDILAL